MDTLFICFFFYNDMYAICWLLWDGALLLTESLRVLFSETYVGNSLINNDCHILVSRLVNVSPTGYKWSYMIPGLSMQYIIHVYNYIYRSDACTCTCKCVRVCVQVHSVDFPRVHFSCSVCYTMFKTWQRPHMSSWYVLLMCLV